MIFQPHSTIEDFIVPINLAKLKTVAFFPDSWSPMCCSTEPKKEGAYIKTDMNRSGEMVRSSQPSASIYPIDQKVHITVNIDHVVVFPTTR